ncbi:MAG: TRAP transporter substrate-binding protein [Leptolyngbyaceae cyanobacterium]
MKRRNFFRDITLGTAGTLSLRNVAHAQEDRQACEYDSDVKGKINWNMATSWPTKDDITFKSAEYFCQQVYDMTDGNFEIKPYIASDEIHNLDGKVIEALEVFSNVQDGVVQCGHTASYYYLDKDISLAFRTGIPFGLNPYQQYAWFNKYNDSESTKAFREKHKLVTFLAGSPGCQMGGWFKDEVNTPSDFKGLRIRIPGFGAKVIERMGAEAFPLGGDKVEKILDGYDIEYCRDGKTEVINKGNLDAIEWQNPYDDEQLGIGNDEKPKLYSFAKHYYYPGFWEPGTTYEIIINLDYWNDLSCEYQMTLKTAAATTNLIMLAEYDARNGEALNRFKQEYEIEPKPFSDEILKCAYNETLALLKEMADEDPYFKSIYNNWKAFQQKIFQWNWYNELAFDSFFHCDE